MLMRLLGKRRAAAFAELVDEAEIAASSPGRWVTPTCPRMLSGTTA